MRLPVSAPPPCAMVWVSDSRAAAAAGCCSDCCSGYCSGCCSGRLRCCCCWLAGWLVPGPASLTEMYENQRISMSFK